MQILEVNGLRKVYTTRFGGASVEALRNINFSVENGEYVAIMGESGSGKTTLLNILAGLDKPTSGSVLLDGKDLASIREADRAAFRRDHLGFVFQEFNLLDTFSVEDNIYLPLVLAGVPQRELSARLEPIAARLGITELLKKYPYEISGGQKQRAAVARAIITNPRLLLADEPTGALDSKATDELLRVFSDISRSGQTILMVTHSVRRGQPRRTRPLYQGRRGLSPALPRQSHRRSALSEDHRRADRSAGRGRAGMTHKLYPRLAWQGITKNKRLYLPFLLTCVGMVTMTYILLSLASSPILKTFPGGDTMPMILGMGSFVMAAFAVLFLFYTNSFLIRRRNREFGLYNILGMGKGNLAKVLAWETVIMALISIVGGEVLGIALGKLFELLLVNIVDGTVQMQFIVSVPATTMTTILYLAIFALLFLRSLVTVCKTNAAALLRSEACGEKPPKANWVFGLAGFLILGAAYYIAVTIKQPLTALAVFFIAVLMVIAATYLIFISGSVVLCRALQKNKRYYYQKNHFISVSSMAYRMKRNGAGLASICILATMVLVMLSSTTCLYFGKEDALRTRYPSDLSVELRFVKDEGGMDEANIAIARGMIEDVIKQDGLDVQGQFDIRSAWFSGLLTGNTFSRAEESTLMDYERAVDLTVLPLEDYTRMTGERLTLAPDEAYFCCPRMAYTQPDIRIGELTYQIKGQLPSFGGFGADSANITTTIYLIVPDFDAAVNALRTQNTRYPVVVSWQYSFDSGSPDEAQIAFLRDMMGTFADNREGLVYASYTVESIASNREDFVGTYGSLFFLAILLSIVFLAAAVLILYYKQISEGYEDQARFEIMQRVGMTKTDIRNSINSQLLLVFFLPLLFAGLHLGFAFPFIHKLLMLFNLTNLKLLIGTTVITFAIYAVFYTLVYRITSNSYYSIVAGAKEEAA